MRLPFAEVSLESENQLSAAEAAYAIETTLRLIGFKLIDGADRSLTVVRAAE